jgi:Na+-driven multidrug efflux pump
MEYPLARQHHVVSHVAAQTILMVVLVSVFLSVVGSLSSIAFSAATATVVGQNIGAGKLERAQRAAHLAGWAAFSGPHGPGIIILAFRARHGPPARTPVTAKEARPARTPMALSGL